MSIRVAYGPEENIEQAIENKTIPDGSIIITKRDGDKAELLFYDTSSKMKRIVSRKEFDSLDDAVAYMTEINMVGKVISILEDEEYKGYIVQADNSLKPLSNDNLNITIIDGGTSSGF